MADQRQQQATTRPARTVAPPQAESKGAVALAEKPKQVTQFEEQFAEYRPNIQAVLPSHIRIEHFERVIITAINNAPELWNADRRSLFNACVQAATDGLMPDGREGALVIYNTKMKDPNGREVWVKKVQWMRMVYGVRKQMRNSGEVLSAVAHVVYENDAFRFVLGDEERIEHEVALKDRGEPLGAYAIIKLKNGETIHEYMSAQEVGEVRAASKSSNSPAWTKWWGEMARKAVLRRASKAAPMSSEMDKAMQREDLDDDPALPGTGAMLIEHESAPPRPTRADFSEDDGGEDVDDSGDQEDGDQSDETIEETSGDGGGEDTKQADDDVPTYEAIDRHGEVIGRHHDAQSYLEWAFGEQDRCKRGTEVIAFVEHNLDAINDAGGRVNDKLFDDLVVPIRERYQTFKSAVATKRQPITKESGDSENPAPQDGQQAGLGLDG